MTDQCKAGLGRWMLPMELAEIDRLRAALAASEARAKQLRDRLETIRDVPHVSIDAISVLETIRDIAREALKEAEHD